MTPTRTSGWACRGMTFLRGWLLIAALTGVGCAHFPPWRKARVIAPVEAPTATEPVGPTEQGPAEDHPVVPTPAPKEKEVPPPTQPRAVVPPVVVPPPAPAATPSDSTRTGTVISEDIPPEEKEALIQTTKRELDETAALLRELDATQLAGKEGDQLRTVQALMKASQEAGDRSEFREAASLAHKAWLLAMELSGR